MSYDLAVWHGDRPLDDDQAGSTYDELFERYLESYEVERPPASSIVAYVEALRERYPDDEQASPQVCSEASGPIVYFTMSYGNGWDVSEYAAALAREHGLVCFDPQLEQLRPTSGDLDETP